ncbi:MAG TPA: hypothetical protein VH281_10920 [Gaiellaceae bacterium]|jgi:hypothetical protein
MPHHWRPIDPSNPTAEEKVGRLVLTLGKRVKFVGRAREDDRVWALLDVDDDELERLAEEGLVTLEEDCGRRLEP